MGKQIPFLSLKHQHVDVEKRIHTAIRRVVNRGQFILGEEVRLFEKKYAAFTGVKFCAGAGNGFDALRMCLLATGVGPGDEVIVPSNTCLPTWLAVSAVGAKVIPVEPRPDTYNIDHTRLASALTARTKAIIPVHLYGQACEMAPIIAIAKKKDIAIIEDNAQGHGASYNGRLTGSFGVINATSFYPTKNLGALGDGGAVTTNDRALYEHSLELRNYGAESSIKAMNSRLDELQAAIVSLKLSKLAKWNKQRQAIAKIYLRDLSGVGDIVLPMIAPGSTHVFHLFVIRSKFRDKLRIYLNKKGIETKIHYPTPPHLQKAYAEGFHKGQFPISEMLAQTCLSIPLWPGLVQGSQRRIIESVRSFFGDESGKE